MKIQLFSLSLSKIIIATVGLMLLTMVKAAPAVAAPTVLRDGFKVELYADLSELGGNLKAFGLTLSRGAQGFPAGLYVTSGPTKDTRSDRLIRVYGPSQMQVVKHGFVSNEVVVFSTGSYPNGMLISIPRQQRIVQLLPGGTLNTFATGFTPSFGPTGLTFSPDGFLYAADSSGGVIRRVYPDGSTSLFAV